VGVGSTPSLFFLFRAGVYGARQCIWPCLLGLDKGAGWRGNHEELLTRGLSQVIFWVTPIQLRQPCKGTSLAKHEGTAHLRRKSGTVGNRGTGILCCISCGVFWAREFSCFIFSAGISPVFTFSWVMADDDLDHLFIPSPFEMHRWAADELEANVFMFVVASNNCRLSSLFLDESKRVELAR
jgi:hypothetical protein